MHIQVDYLSNRLSVSGDAHAVAKAKALLVAGANPAASRIGFGKILPLPYTGSYEESAQETWGCWGDPIAAAVVEDTVEGYSVTFDTAQGPPAAAMQALSALVPGATVSLDCVWSVDPHEVSASGRWTAGEGGLEQVEASRTHYLSVRPDTEDWDLDDHFPDARPAP